MKYTYKEFLRSGWWADLRYAKLQANPRCECCNSTRQLQVHHKLYRKSWYDSVVQDLQTICRECHRKSHGIGESMNEIGVARRQIRVLQKLGVDTKLVKRRLGELVKAARKCDTTRRPSVR